jgi:hypothetical protein
MESGQPDWSKCLRNAWAGLAFALAVHVTDEALTGFLPVYNRIVEEVRSQFCHTLNYT